MTNFPVKEPLSNWHTNLIRLTVFPCPNIVINQNWWKEVIGEEPEQITSQPKVPFFQISGPLNNEKLTLLINPIKIDWIFTPNINTEDIGQLNLFPDLGTFPETIDVFLPIVKKWFSSETCPRVLRIGFGVILLQPVKDKIEGYQILSSYLKPINIDVENSSDLVYQINRPRESKNTLKTLKINRLTNWSVINGHLAIFNPIGIGKNETIARPTDDIVIKLELDINTTHDYRGEFNPGESDSIFEELLELGKEIAVSGDIP